MIINSETVHEMGSLTDARLLDHSAPSSGDTATEQANVVKRSFGVHGDDGNIGDNRVLRESRSAHLFMM